MRRAQRDLLFEAVALDHLSSVWRVALALGGSEAEAEDLTQETYLRAYERFRTFRPGTNCRAWLLTILRHLAADRYRSAPREAALEEPDSLEDRPAAASPPAIENEEAFLDLFGDEVNAFLRRLSGEGRTALLLCDVEGLSYAEIAHVLDCPVGTVRSRIHRARAFLRERLAAYARSLGYLKEPRE